MYEVIIEKYKDRDKEEVIDLILNIQKNEFGIPINLTSQPDLLKISEYYQTSNGNFWVVKMKDTIVGTISLLDIGNGQCALRKMFVFKEYRGKEWGVGQKLMNHLIEWAIQKRVKEIYLGTTEKFIAAQHFYKRNGFKEIRINELPKAFPVMEVDVKFYRYNLSC